MPKPANATCAWSKCRAPFLPQSKDDAFCSDDCAEAYGSWLTNDMFEADRDLAQADCEAEYEARALNAEGRRW